MKKISTLLIITLLCYFNVFAQDTTGLIAHWKLNGNALDATGHGHNGFLHNVLPSSGKAGATNTAFYFNGSASTPSYISVPYSPAFNVNKFSICVTLKILGFYSGVCQANIVFDRGGIGSSSTTGHYSLYFTDNAVDGDNCAAYDSTIEGMEMGAGGNSSPGSAWQYTPHLLPNQWYSFVAIFDSTNYKLYVDGILKDSIAVSGPSPIGTSSDSLVFGYDIWEAPTFPYPFKGIMDDVRLYNRALTVSEISAYDTSTLAVQNTINKEPEISVYPNPASNKISIQLADNDLKGSIRLLNELGQTISEKQISNGAASFDIAKMPTGMYLLRIESDEQVFYRRFIKN